jgi:hypothetical protein
MFDTEEIAGLDATAACAAITATQDELREREWRELALAAHWATLHGPDTLPNPVRGGVRGAERAVAAGGDGTPLVAEFACAELAVLMGTGYVAADRLIGDAVDLRHRHPRLWAALATGRGRVWKARKVARMCTAADLTRTQAGFVDEATTPYIDTLPWSRFQDLVAAKIIEADPAAAQERATAAELARFVATGQSNQHGLKTLIARASAGDVIFFVAICDRIAQILAGSGDTDPVDVRRSKAIGILAHPARALELLATHSTPGRFPTQHPTLSDDNPDDTSEAPGAASDTAEEPAPVEVCGTCGQAAGPVTFDPDRMRPRAVLYLRISEQTLRDHTGVVACENPGVGPLTLAQAQAFLGHCHVTIRPVLDHHDQLPVDAYEIPTAMREALHLTRPSTVFPWTATHGRVDLDHTHPYLHPDQGGPPAQTRIDNLGPLTRFAHRVKTHGRGWRHHQPTPGVYLWRTPHGYWYQVDTTGTHPLGQHPHPTGLPPTNSPLEHALAQLILAA